MWCKTLGEKRSQSYYPALNPTTFQTNMPSKMCPLVPWWQFFCGGNRMFSDWISDLFHSKESMPETRNLFKNQIQTKTKQNKKHVQGGLRPLW